MITLKIKISTEKDDKCKVELISPTKEILEKSKATDSEKTVGAVIQNEILKTLEKLEGEEENGKES